MDTILNILNDGDECFNATVDKKEGVRKKKCKSIKVEPVIKIKDDYSEPPHPNLLRMPFSLLLVAPKGSGKTTILHNLLVWYYSYFDNVFIFSPTIHMDLKWKKLIERLQIPPENLFTSYRESEVSNLMGIIKDYNNCVEENNDKIKCLLIFDDIIEQLPKGKKISSLNKLAMNHRHFNISHIIVSQSFKKIDPVVRSNTTGLVLFNTDNSAERAKIVEELCGNLGRAKFEKSWIDCVSKKYGFMFLNYDTRLIYENFDRVIGDLDCEPEYLFGKLDRQKNNRKRLGYKKSDKTEEPESDSDSDTE